ncbi:MAG: phage envelope protein [Flavobacteriaceae bacterium]|nr:MAG: phage envelope protein [Flavobacteriaceae bacterium]
MFTVDQIEQAHQKVQSGADFPNYIREIKSFGVKGFETFVFDSHTVYFGENNFTTSSDPKYDVLDISDQTNQEAFIAKLKAHQRGETDYFTFCTDCSQNGIERWVVDLQEMTCIYYDKKANQILVEKIPS